MNYTDLFVVALLVSALYGLIVALARQKNFLTKAVNPHRAAWLLAAVSLLWVGLGLLRLETGSWDLDAWRELLSRLVHDAPLSPRGKAASVALFLGALFVVLVVWCWLCLPRDPSTFHRPEDRKRAFRYYVTMRGGLDYAVLCREDGERLEEAYSAKQVQARLDHLPRIVAEGERKVRTTDDQIQFWRTAAVNLHRSMRALDEAIAPARQGRNRRIVFDGEYGGLFFVYLRGPDPADKAGDCLYLFAATLNQREMNRRTADEHFALLVQALPNIDANIRVA